MMSCLGTPTPPTAAKPGRNSLHATKRRSSTVLPEGCPNGLGGFRLFLPRPGGVCRREFLRRLAWDLRLNHSLVGAKLRRLLDDLQLKLLVGSNHKLTARSKLLPRVAAG